MRVIIYEMSNGTEETFDMPTIEAEQHERAQAERELRNPDTDVIGYRFAWQDQDDATVKPAP